MTTHYPLCIDLDDTLVLTDTFAEQMKQALFRKPWIAAGTVFQYLRHGRPRAKAWLCTQFPLDAAKLPYRTGLVDYIREQKAAGRKVYLVSAADQDNVSRVAHHLGIFDAAFGTHSDVNLKGENKGIFIRDTIGPDFVYAGDAFVDMAVWKYAKGAILCGKAVIFRAGLGIPVERDFPNRGS